MTKKYQIKNYVTVKDELFDTEEEALFAIQTMEADLLVAQAARFSVVEILITDKGTMWVTASENSYENNDYMVFNSKIGSYETIHGRTEAYSRNQKLKDEFLSELAQVPKIVDITQPNTTGTQTI
jgi:predicted transcriptional regulator